MDFKEKPEKHVPVVVDSRQKNLTKGYHKSKEIPKYWDRDYITANLEKISNYRHKMLLTLLWMSGIRVSEATSLIKGNIDFENYTMTIKWLKNKKQKNRVVPLHPNLRNLLQLYTASINLEDRIFPISRQRAWQIVRKYFDGSPHQFRHSFAVNWLRCDGDLIILHKILGHSKIQTTMEYLKIVPTDQGKELLKIRFQ